VAGSPLAWNGPPPVFHHVLDVWDNDGIPKLFSQYIQASASRQDDINLNFPDFH
jgi:hypothetical protein